SPGPSSAKRKGMRLQYPLRRAAPPTRSVASNTNSKGAKGERALTLATPLQYLKGLGPARAAAFARKGILTLQDALYYFPRRYEDRRRLCEPKDLISLS